MLSLIFSYFVALLLEVLAIVAKLDDRKFTFSCSLRNDLLSSGKVSLLL